MAMLDESLIQHIGEKRYYEILRTLELQEAKSFRYYDNKGKQHKLTQKEVLKRMNRRLIKINQSPISLSWVKKWWNK
ncbi:hypothetical protein [Bacillus cereus group sp. TH152-1LC]|uniref:hypothetical protein n=1 Tax=Bacillus cereus group sp. TH152-1LC TaxID=3018060 RepID=UPI0022E8231B|nr:hypothetical protein [Bacillus cereus group sp. TH152-1LC]MDA1678652.1 hypothetical protein [Bacillus cereus group sp. TH152-1LC]